jgi:transcriptional regulator with XRE-family HTH domain
MDISAAKFNPMDHDENRTLLTPEMCRAARAFLDWTQADLAERAAVSRGTVRDYEANAHAVHRSTPALLRRALEDGGVRLEARDGGGLALVQDSDTKSSNCTFK